MDAFTFVAALKKSVQNGVDHEWTRLCDEIPPTASPHLLLFAEWIKGLSANDKATAHDLVRFVAEGSLFRVLVYLDNRSQLVDEQGQLELWHIAVDGVKARLNDPDGELLNDIFNELG